MSETISHYAENVFSLHPTFVAARQKFQFLLDAYHGTGGFEDGSYLDPHPRELHLNTEGTAVLNVLPKFNWRKARAYYPNIVKTLVNVPVQYVYQSEIRRDGSKEFVDFKDDCNGRGTSLNTMMQSLSRYARLFGAMFFVVDKPRPEVLPKTRADEAGLKPRLVPVFPSDIVDWYMKDGQLQWVKILERHEDASDPLAPRTIKHRIKLWTKKDWSLYECPTAIEDPANRYSGGHFQKWEFPVAVSGREATALAKLIDSGTHDLGEVPLVGVYAGDEPEFGEIYATTDIAQSAMIARRIYNLFSELDEILRDQTFSILTIPVDNVEQGKAAAIGTTNGLAYKSPANGLRPEYISPDGECAKTLLEAIATLRLEMYRAANLHFQEGVQEVRSGVARAWTFDQTNRFLATMAKNGESSEIRGGRLAVKWMRPQGAEVTDDDVLVQYPGTFNISDLKEAIEQADMVIATGISKTFAGRIAKDLVAKMLPNLPTAMRKQIEQEIDESPNLLPPAIDESTSADAAKSGLRARVKAKRGRVKREQTTAQSTASVAA